MENGDLKRYTFSLCSEVKAAKITAKLASTELLLSDKRSCNVKEPFSFFLNAVFYSQVAQGSSREHPAE